MATGRVETQQTTQFRASIGDAIGAFSVLMDVLCREFATWIRALFCGTRCGTDLLDQGA